MIGVGDSSSVTEGRGGERAKTRGISRNEGEIRICSRREVNVDRTRCTVEKRIVV
jgi:hypothetical protein